MNRIDVSKAADVLICSAAPERVDELSELWGTGRDRVHLTEKGEFDINEVFGLIQVTEITLREIWLLSFAAWSAIQAYGGLFWYLNLVRQPFERDVIAGLHGQTDIDAAYDALLAKARALRSGENLHTFEWPANVPEPTPENIFSNRHDEAAFNLACIAGAYVFLHEIRHVRFSREGDRPSDSRVEELECDAFARRFLLEKVDAYARGSGKLVQDVRAKRALGVAVAKAVIMEVQDHWESTATHPAGGVRVRSFLEDVPEPVREWFWLCSASFLAAICRTRGRLPARLDFSSARDLALALANCL
jgi:hypothetical protein